MAVPPAPPDDHTPPSEVESGHESRGHPPYPTTLGRYDVVGCIGRGGMSLVYRAVDPVLGREVAIKALAADLLTDPHMRARLHREARAVAGLQHVNIVTVFEFFEEGGRPYLVMEFLQGATLTSRIHGGQMGLEEKLDIVQQLCRGLHYAHERGIVHRDVKPSNVWLAPDGTVKIIDFGIARELKGGRVETTAIVGTAAYMAPEQIEGRAVDRRADVFSCGVVLYELLSGRRPFDGETASAVMLKILQDTPVPLREACPELPDALIRVVDQALQKRPEQRQADARELAEQVAVARSLLAPSNSGTTPPLTFVEPVPFASSARLKQAAEQARTASQRSKRRAALLGAGLAACALVATAGLAWRVKVTGTAVTSASANAVVAPTPATISVTTSPPGARIWLNGNDTGLVTPGIVSLPGVWPATIVVEKRGFARSEVSVARDAAAHPISLTLDPQVTSKTLTLSGSYAFAVYRGREALSPPSRSHRLTLDVTGAESLRLVSREVFLDREITIGPETPDTVAAPRLGTVQVRTVLEACSIKLDGRDLGLPPLDPIKVVEGRHTLNAQCPDGTTRPGTPLVVTAGITQTYRLR